MIRKLENYFIIETRSLSYIFHVNETNHLIIDYFGDHIDVDKDSLKALGLKEECPKGCSNLVDDKVALDNQFLEFSMLGKGDFKEPSLIIKNKTRGYMFDIRYVDYKVNSEVKDVEILPMPHKLDEELVVILKDVSLNIYVDVHYYISNKHDVITKNIVVRNEEEEELSIEKIVSLQLDIPNSDYDVLNLNGAWAGETHKEVQKIHRGIYINDSKSGLSSNTHNPFFLIKEGKSTEDYGQVYSFNLMYSGNHQELVELNSFDHLHIQTGINPTLFSYTLKKGESFIAPFAIMTYSSKGTNLSSQRMSDFINDCVVNSNFSYRLRPILINNWEGTYFNFTESKLLAIAKKAKEFGIELFVLDDGWFGVRNDDTSSLGDYDVNAKKLPHGLDGLAKKINKMGMKFGLWFEPEAISENSSLYHEHPEYAISTKDIKPSLGRHELLLDLTKVEVQDYIIDNVSKTLESANIEYVKWDMNRSITDPTTQGEFHHRYVLGLYRVISTLTKKFPNILFENCSSGGNRFDLGMLHYFPQTWASDCSDSYERVFIQGGLFYGYPTSCVTGHVSSHLNHQMLRDTNYQSKFVTASFGCLGYELMLNELTKVQQDMIKKQVEFYKENRELFQFGDFYRLKEPEYHGDSAMWMMKAKDNKTAVVGYINGLQSATPKETIIKNLNLDSDKKYSISVFTSDHEIKEFGSLVNMVLPIHVNPDGWLIRTYNKSKGMPSEKEEYILSGSIINNGLILKSEWAGNGYNENVRVLGDFGARLYLIKEVE